MGKLAIIALCGAALPLLQGCSAGSRTPYGERSCGLLACITSPYLKAKLGPSMIGQPVSAALSAAGAPDSSYSTDGAETLTWRREQAYQGGMLQCSETITARGGVISGYRFNGHC